MNKSEYLEELRKHRFKTLPIYTYPIGRSLGFNPYDITINSDIHAKVLTYTNSLYNFGFTVGLMDLTIEAEAFGNQVVYHQVTIPTLGPRVIQSISDAKSLLIPSLEYYRTNAYIETMKKAKPYVKGTPLLATVVGPFTLTSMLLGTKEIKGYVKENPAIIEETLFKVNTFLMRYYNALIHAGADGLFICEPMAAFLDNETCEKYSSTSINHIIESLGQEAIIVYHNCGDVSNITESLKNIYCDIYHFGDINSIQKILNSFPKHKLIMGNLSPVKAFQKASHKGVERATHTLLKKCRNYDNFIISPGCDLPVDVAFEKIVAHLKTIEKFYHRG